METVLVVLIVLGALAYMGRKFYKAVTARGRGSCGCGSCRCGEGAGHMSCAGGKHKELTPPCCSRPQ
ncbi:hypothetical protein [uncultured Desulfovibrio sp.]|uniref:hypothetical protein n=1 Tax=uncultured Desulfovibrio sp. TaxID=167968 RepID=UPI0026191FA2|nr:hypothetical protein [uncultured Desulfovibrio sp.]